MAADEALRSAVVRIVADALDVDTAKVQMHSSLIDDLGAESIDFLDILYRIESTFHIRIPEGELWRGAIDPSSDQASIDEAVRRLRERMPGFRWDRLPERPGRTDLPRLISVATIVDYLEGQGVSVQGNHGTEG